MNYKNTTYIAWLLLRITYSITPILIGIDKLYTWWLVNWAKYSSKTILQMIPLTIHQYVLYTGLIEIIAGIIVWFYPRFGGYLVAAWMLLVVINLATMNQYYDIIARDIVIGIGSLALALLSENKQLLQRTNHA